MTSFFTAKKWEGPFSSSQLSQLIDQATDGSLASENWSLNMEICDLVNESEDAGKDAFKSIRKKLQQNAGKNHQVIMYTLIVLETCVKNCGRKFHILICSNDFIMELVKLIGPKNDPPTAVQEKVLGLIQSWADAFRNQPDCQGVNQVYQDLRAKGIEFPMTDLDTMAPIHTPTRSQQVKEKIPPGLGVGVAGAGGGGAALSVGGLCAGGAVVGAAAVESANPPVAGVGSGKVTVLSQEQLTKLKRELDIVESNMAVFGEMLTEMNPQAENADDYQLLQELNSTCKEMQERLVELIPRLANDHLTAELLRINDLLNILFLRHSRYEKKREAVKEGRGEAEGRGGGEAASLIDLSDSAATHDQHDAAVTNSMANLALGTQLAGLNTVTAQLGPKKTEDKEFDMFAQSRNVPYDQAKNSGSTYESNQQPDQVSGSLAAMTEAKAIGGTTQMHKESDFNEMAAWLGDSGPASMGMGMGEESMTSSEFDRFLAERAAAADNLPSTNQPTTNHPNIQH